MRKVIIILIVLSALVSCKKKEAPKQTRIQSLTSGLVTIASDENFKDLIDTEIQVFESFYQHNAIVFPRYGTEAEVMRLLVEDSVKFALVTRDLYPYEAAELEKRKLFARKHLIAFDGVAILNNPNNPDSLITVEQIRKILTGEITQWKQIYPQSPLGRIQVVFDNKESGVLRYAADSICRGVNLADSLYATNGYTELLNTISKRPNAIGLLGANILADEYNKTAIEYRNKVRMMRVSSEDTANLENSYMPLAGDINKEDYPFWRSIYVLLTEPTSGLASGFTNFLTHERGQKVVLHSGLMPITDSHILQVRVLDKMPE